MSQPRREPKLSFPILISLIRKERNQLSIYITEREASFSFTEELETHPLYVNNYRINIFLQRDVFLAYMDTNFMIIEMYAIDIKKTEPCKM